MIAYDTVIPISHAQVESQPWYVFHAAYGIGKAKSVHHGKAAALGLPLSLTSLSLTPLIKNP